MNEQGDIGLTGPAIHTAEGKYLMLNDLIHPDDAVGYQGYYVNGISSRNNETGLPSVVVSGRNGSTNGFTLYDNYLLTPELSSNRTLGETKFGRVHREANVP